MTSDAQTPTPESARGPGRLALALVALVVVVALIQLAVSVPGGSSSATPDSVATCNFLFPHAELPSDHVTAVNVENFRLDCERGQRLPK
jgi:hypothetical protein